MFRGARILVAPLDWGLGHATRCVPIVHRLLAHGAEPILAADGDPYALLRAEFPDLEHVRLPGIPVRYSAGSSHGWSMTRQFPAMLRNIRKENELTARFRAQLKLDAVISDQRFGVRSGSIPSVIITHQVFPFTPFAQAPLRRLNHLLLSKFDACWIMDTPEPPGLAGGLSHGRSLLANARYIGTQSRFTTAAPSAERRHRIVAVISGPEPQRAIFQDLLIDALQRVPGDHLLVSGTPNAKGARDRGNISIVPHMPTDQLAAALASAELIVTRSGYSSLMDLQALGRTALIVPTPGQSEQEYLGNIHAGSGRFVVQAQNKIDLNAALNTHSGAAFPPAMNDGTLLERALESLADAIQRTPSVTFSKA